MSRRTRFFNSLYFHFFIMAVCSPFLGYAQCGTITISKQPSASVICAGSTTTFSVSATGTGLNYQWRQWGADISESAVFSGTKTATLTIKNAPSTLNNNAYSVIISSNCTFVQSIEAFLTVKTPPAITSQPSDNVGCLGGKAEFGVVANGELLNYQWKVNGTDITTNSTYAGATSGNMTINAVSNTMNGNTYSVAISNGCAPSIVSTTAKFSVSPTVTPTITISTASSTTLCGGTPVTLKAEISDGGSPPKFQWRINAANTGTDASSFTTSALANGDVVTCVLTSNSQCVTKANVTSNPIGFSITSASATIVANPGTDLCTGSPVKFSVTPTNGGAPTYQWQVNGSPITAATSTTFTSSTLKNGDQVSVMMTPTGICTVPKSSNVLKMNISSGPSITLQPKNVEQCLGKNIQFSVSASGFGLTYQWKKDSKLLSGAIQSKLVIEEVSASDIGSYEVEVSGLCSTSPTKSDLAILTVDSSPNCVPFGVGLEDNVMNYKEMFLLHPNPSSGDVKLLLQKGSSRDFLLQLMNTKGELVLEKTISMVNGEYLLGSSDFAQEGVFVVKLIASDKVFIQRVVYNKTK